jgi:site-specific DNA recombinase
MKIADLYIRVSTDEQADKGYSQRSQEEFLRKYCDINKISIRKVILEDHSAKTFNRPEWKKYLLELRKHKYQADFVLFLKWDRFSRNAGDAYQMINTLRKLGVEPQAIEQPLDLSVPENKMMLAFYLAAPEVENDRRALNVIHGMRRARKEGRYMGLAPIGYINKTDEAGRKLISPKEPQADILRWAFTQISEGVYNTEQIYKMAKEKGFSGTKGLFWFAIRNPVYCGKIFIPKYKDEESRFVKGLHEPIISEALYYQAQDVLDGRKRNYRLKVVSNESLPLRGFIICPLCNKLLTGSASKGHTKYYAYYHCTDGCSCRYRADKVNQQFIYELKKYIPKPEMIDLFKILITEAWSDQTNHFQDDAKQLRLQIKELEEKIDYIRDLLSSKQIESADFREMKTEYSIKLEKLEVKLSTSNYDKVDINSLLSKGINNLLKLDYVYETADIEKKREIISSMYPEKMTFDGFAVRTNRINEVARLIYSMDVGFSENKNRANQKISSLSCQVGKTGFEPATPWSQTRCATGLRYFPIPFGLQIYTH